MVPWLLQLVLLTVATHDYVSTGPWQQNPEQQHCLVQRLLKRYSPNDLLRIEPSAACGGGLGVFATTEIAPGTVIAEIPVTKCLTIHTETDHDDDEYRMLVDKLNEFLSNRHHEIGPISREGIVVSIKLLLLHRKYHRNKKEGISIDHPQDYVASLQWDALHSPLHPFMDDNIQNPGPVWKKARRDAKIAEILLQQAGVTTSTSSLSLYEECLASMALVQSRAFQLSKAQLPEDSQKFHLPHCAMVPVLDLFNHPSMSALNYFNDQQILELPISQATIAWNVMEQEPTNIKEMSQPQFIVQVCSPKGMHLKPGQEIWNWYGDGGYVSDPIARQQGRRWDFDANRAFVEIYGFDPWK
jgi:hypothetical protein